MGVRHRRLSITVKVIADEIGLRIRIPTQCNVRAVNLGLHIVRRLGGLVIGDGNCDRLTGQRLLGALINRGDAIRILIAIQGDGIDVGGV